MSQEGSRYILIAEDDADDRLLYEEAIRQGNHQIAYVFVGSGEELIGYLRSESNPKPALIMLDFKMPGMSFDDVISAIEDDPKLNRIPLVIVTGSAALGETRTCVKHIVTKPVTIQEWVNTLDQVFTYGFENLRLPSPTDGRLSPLTHHPF
ncbi:MAG: response regulator [Desulfobacteraceae bacterium]|nr:MAG: response regulator [Desulfobacteraceae bacterium]